jgi:hypothetical protein
LDANNGAYGNITTGCDLFGGLNFSSSGFANAILAADFNTSSADYNLTYTVVDAPSRFDGLFSHHNALQ